MRKKAREERAALVTKFVVSASVLLDDPTILANAPAGTSAAVLRAAASTRLTCCRRTFKTPQMGKQ